MDDERKSLKINTNLRKVIPDDFSRAKKYVRGNENESNSD